MSVFWVRGFLAGREREVRWQNGTLTGDALLVALLPMYERALEGASLGPVGGPYRNRDYLSDPLSAVFLMREVFDSIAASGGDLPVPPTVPAGAIP